MTALRKPGSADQKTPGSAFGNQQFRGAGLHKSCMGCNSHRPTTGGLGTGVRWRCAACLEAKKHKEAV